MPAQLTHVALFVRDVGRTIEFYRKFAGLHVVHQRVDNDVPVAWLSEQESEPRFVIVAIQMEPGPQGSPPNMAHFGYDLPSRQAVDDMAASRDGGTMGARATLGPRTGAIGT